MDEEQDHREERDEPAAEQPVDQRVAEDPRYQEKQVLQGVAGEVDVAAVLQVQRALDEQERQFEDHAVDAVEVQQEVLVRAPGVVEGHDGDVALDGLIHAHAVVVERERPDQQEEGAHREQPAVRPRQPHGGNGGRPRLHAAPA